MISHWQSAASMAGGSCSVSGVAGCKWEGGGEHFVALFLSTFVNKVDRKGRVSVPASFRAALAGQSFNGIIAFPSFKTAAIEGTGIDRIEEMSTRVDALDQFSEDSESLAASIFADSHQLAFDSEGRIVLPQVLAEHAGITENAAFVGLGRTFQIWEPAAHQAHQAGLRERAKRQGTTLPGARALPPGTGGPR
jgi:MraZ protein